MFQDLLAGLNAIANPLTIWMLLFGNVLGYIFGILPGIAGLQAMALVLPFTFGMAPVSAMYLYAGIMGATTLGGALTSILINTPGDPGNIATTIEGYQMTRRGEVTRAIAIASFASAFGTFFGVLVLIVLLPVAEKLILNLRAPEMFWIIVLGLLSIAFVVRGNFVKGVVGALVGLLIALIGQSPMFPMPRFDFGISQLWGGVDLVIFLLGVFAISEIFALGAGQEAVPRLEISNWKEVLEGLKDNFRYPVTIVRSSVIGTIIGIIPGLGASVANVLAYATTVQFDKLRKGERSFGTGNRRGLVACESSNHAKDGGALLTTVAFGVPGSPEMAVLLGAFVLHGLQPGLMLVTEHGDIVWALILGLCFSQVITVAWTLLTSRWSSRILAAPAEFIVLSIFLACLFGGYERHENIWDMFTMVGAGLLAFVMKRFGFSVVGMAIGFILGDYAERSLNQSLAISLGSVSILFTRPISMIIIGIIVIGIILPIWSAHRTRRKGRLENDGEIAARPAREKAVDRTSVHIDKGALIFELFLMAAVVFFFYSSIRLGPGPGTFPLFVSSAALLLLILIVVSEFFPNVQRYFQSGIESLLGGGVEGAEESPPGEEQERVPVTIVVEMAALVILIPIAIFFLGFFVGVPLCFLPYLIVCRKMRWSTAVIFTVVVWIALYFGLDLLMQFKLWRGAIPELFPGWVGGEIVPRFW
ncbi:MAG: tricarboxylic transporter [Deltaproteobacteria bacterium]|nr:tricarboxylic transporter [Deltaproteobacteria bacterium]